MNYRITELEPNEITKNAIAEAKHISEEFESGNKDIKPVDLSSVESMLSSCES